MPEHCDKCGIKALESQKFTPARVLFGKPKHFCPECYRKYVRRVTLLFYGLLFAVLCLSRFLTTTPEARILDRILIWICCLFFVHIAIIVPHELGHALVARYFKFTDIRILVGSGKHLFTTKLIGFPFIFNRVPFGGFTLFKPIPDPRPWKSLAVLVAGPLVSVLIILAALPFVSWNGFFGNYPTLAVLLVGTNVVVLLENLLPFYFRSQFGTTPNDGMQILQLFSRRKPGSQQIVDSQPISRLELIICYTLKWLILLITTGTCVLLAACGVWFVFDPPGTRRASLDFIVAIVCTSISFLTGWITVRIFKEPINRFRKPRPTNFFTSEQVALIQTGNAAYKESNFTAAEKLFEQALRSFPTRNLNQASQVFIGVLKCFVARGDINGAMEKCLAFVNEDVHEEQKLNVLDGFACTLLYDNPSRCLPQAETIARKAVERFPGHSTLKGTLGGILTEQGEFEEAEPLLKECLDRSEALHDQAISSFYLGWIRLARGEVSEGKRLINYAKLAYPEPWLLAKAKAKTMELLSRTSSACLSS